MRIELKDENQEEPQKTDENDLRNKHESDLTKKEKRELERQKLAEMNFAGKLQYIWAYYKPQIFGFIGIIVAVFVVWDIYQNAQIKTALNITVINSYGTMQEEAEKAVEEELGIQDDPYQIVTVDESMDTGEDGISLENYSQMSFTTKVAARALDVLIGPEEYIDGFENKASILQILQNYCRKMYTKRSETGLTGIPSLWIPQSFKAGLRSAYTPVMISVLGEF